MGTGHRGLVVAHDAGDGAAVILLHGQPGTAADWVGVTERLPAEIRVIVPDRPGYGRTDGRATGFAGNAEAVLELLDRLHVERAHVAGYSWAGGAALALTERAPERVTGLTLVSSVRPGASLSPIDRALAVPFLGAFLSAGAIGLTGLMLQIPPIRRGIDRRYRGTTEAGLAATGQAMAGTRAGLSFFREQRALVEELPGLAASLSAVTVPTTVVFGSNDRIVPPAEGEALARSIPGSRAILVEGAGHLLPHERPDVVAGAILDAVLAGEP